MVNFQNFITSDDTARNIREALCYCKEHNENGLVFPKNTYHIHAKYAFEGVFCISNHGTNGFKRVLFLLDGFSDFTLDLGGSTFIFEDVMIPAVIDHCQNVTIKNGTFQSNRILAVEGEVVDSGEDWFDMRLITNEPHFSLGTSLFVGCEKENRYQFDNYELWGFTECDANGNFVSNAADTWHFLLTEKQNGIIHATEIDRKIPMGHRLSFLTGTRRVCGIFCNRSTTTALLQLTLLSGVGMGVLAQNCNTITIDGMVTAPRKGMVHSMNADATHFVHCAGDIIVQNCDFSAQMDDALNIHGMYLAVDEVYGDRLLLRYGHVESIGIDILRPGERLALSHTDTLIPYGEYKIKDVTVLNTEYTEVVLDRVPEDVMVGDVADEISWRPNLYFRNNHVHNNRARGMLLAANGKIVVEHNHFQTPGCAILFEANGSYWFESGGTTDVEIRENIFEHCAHTPWGANGTINVCPREKTEENLYYHKKISITANRFTDCKLPLARIDNCEYAVFRNNVYDATPTQEVLVTTHCKTVENK